MYVTIHSVTHILPLDLSIMTILFLEVFVEVGFCLIVTSAVLCEVGIVSFRRNLLETAAINGDQN